MRYLQRFLNKLVGRIFTAVPRTDGKCGLYYFVIAMFGLQTSLVSGANWNTKTPDEESKSQPAIQEWTDINHSTSRYIRSQYMCKVATQPNMKPAAKGLDHYLMGGADFVYADLYGDGTLELISNYADETYDAESNGPAHKGSRFRSRNRHPYMFFSPKGDIKLPDNAEFLMAVEMLGADFNGDGKDDVVFLQHGPDYAPYERMKPDILLSKGDEYEVIAFPGEAGLFHGGAAGDIDRDGDIDIVAGPGKASRTIAYINDGTGHFSYNEIIGRNSDWKVNAKRRWGRHALWDIDKDGYLDLIVDATKPLTSIYWGKEKSLFGGYFESKPAPIDGDGMEHTWVHDFEFGDFDNDGKLEMAMLASLRDPQNLSDEFWGEHGFYSGYAIYYVHFDGRRIESVEQKIFELPISTRHFGLWLSDFTACDLQGDGDLDFVHEIHGEKSFTTQFLEKNQNHWGLDKIVWINDGSGNLKQENIPSPVYYPPNQLDEIYASAEMFGVSNRLYETRIIFNPTPNGKRYFEKSEMIPDGVEKATRLNLLGLMDNSSSASASKRPEPKVDKPADKNPKDLAKSKSGMSSNGPINNLNPDGTISTKEICTSAIHEDRWNSNSPKWVAEAKRRGLSVDMCKLFLN